MDYVPESKEKNEQMYRAVRFQRNSSTAMKRNAEVFRLKRLHKNHEKIDYATNMCQYLDQTRGISSISMDDLRNVLNGPNSIVEVDATYTDQSEPTEEVSKEGKVTNYQCGEHVTCVRADNVSSDINWHLGVVNRYDYERNELFVSYMLKAPNSCFQRRQKSI